MSSMEALTTFFGWCTALNLGLLIVASVSLVAMGGSMSKIHSKMFRLSDEDLSRTYFQYLAQYKIGIFVFNLVPYIALKMMNG